MPFSDLMGIKQEEWSEIYTELFSKAIEESGLEYDCERSDVRNGAFTKDIVQNLKNADIVLADITHFNGNVMWELGVRHSLKNRTIIVARENVMSEKIISDLSNYAVISYNPTNLKKINEFKKKIKEILKKMDEEPDRIDSPVLEYMDNVNITMSNFEKKQIINNLLGLMSELFSNLELIDDIKSGKDALKKGELTTSRFLTTAVDHLFISNYLTVEPKLHKKLRFLEKSWITINALLEHASLELHNNEISDYLINAINTNIKEIEGSLPEVLDGIREIYSNVKTGIYVYSEPKFIAHKRYVDYFKKNTKVKKKTNRKKKK